MRITSTTQPVRRDDVTYHAIDDEALVYDPDRGATHRLNSTARFIWEHCDGASNCGSIATALTNVWDATQVQANEDVRVAVGLMIKNGILEVQRD